MALDYGCETSEKYFGDGSKTDFTFNFQIIQTEDLGVAFFNALTKEYFEIKPDDDFYGWSKPDETPLIRFDNSPPNGQEFIIYRLTEVDPLKAIFHGGHPVKADDLNDNFEQLQFAILDNRCAIERLQELEEVCSGTFRQTFLVSSNQNSFSLPDKFDPSFNLTPFIYLNGTLLVNSPDNNIVEYQFNQVDNEWFLSLGLPPAEGAVIEFVYSAPVACDSSDLSPASYRITYLATEPTSKFTLPFNFNLTNMHEYVYVNGTLLTKDDYVINSRFITFVFKEVDGGITTITEIPLQDGDIFDFIYSGGVDLNDDSGTLPSYDPLHRLTRFNVRQEMDNDNIDADTAVSRAFVWAVSNLETPSIYFPSGKYNITVSQSLQYTPINQQITIYGDGGRGEGTEIVVGATINIGHPVNINNIKFNGAVNGPSLLFRRNPDHNERTMPLQDDMDSTITNCVFGNGGSANTQDSNGDKIYLYPNAVDIDYRGRNLEVKGSRFVTGGPTGRAIKLSYFCNTAEVIKQDKLGWNRIMISDNNFHNFDSGCIEIGSSVNIWSESGETSRYPKLRGLVLANNTLETDGVFLMYTSGSNCRLEGAAITGNTLIAYKDRTIIDIQTAHASTITGNTFNGYAENSKLINVNINTALACTITGNAFNSGQGTTTGSGALSGIDWTGCVVVGNTWFGDSTGRINITNPVSCDIQSAIGAPYED